MGNFPVAASSHCGEIRLKFAYMCALENQTNRVPHSVLAVGHERNNVGECFIPLFATASNNFTRLCFVETEPF